jgi:2-phosphosulfolactate phosphatase
VVVIVDVLRFSTAVDAVLAAGGQVIPVEWARRGSRRRSHAYLSPVELARTTRPGDRVELPSPNGAQLSVEAARTGAQVVCGCLRNASAVAAGARRLGDRITVIAAGERWPDGALRPCFEDLAGAAAVLAALGAEDTIFASVRDQLPGLFANTFSGRELAGWGFGADVAVAAEADASRVVPILDAGVYRPI